MNLSALQDLIGDEKEAIQDFLETAKDEMKEVFEDLQLASTGENLELFRSIHHAIKPTLDILSFDNLNNLFDLHKESMRSRNELNVHRSQQILFNEYRSKMDVLSEELNKIA